MVLAARGLLGTPAVQPGEEYLVDLIKQVEAEELEALDPGSPFVGVYHENIECHHCGKPSTPAYRWLCSRGYRTGLCQGIKGPHVHVSCSCSREHLYAVKG